MSLRRYGILLKKYLQDVKPIKYSSLIIDGSLMDFLLDKEQYLYKFAEMIRLQLQDAYPQPTTHEFVVMAKYVNLIDSMVEEFVRDEIMRIV